MCKRVILAVLYSRHETLELFLRTSSSSLQIFREGGSSTMAVLQEVLRLSTYVQCLNREIHKIKSDLQSLKQVSEDTQYIEYTFFL